MENNIQTKKFHTFSIKRYLVGRINPKDVTKRMLLLLYLQNSSLNYRTEEEIVRAEENLYDFKFQISSDLHGKYWMLCYSGSAIHPDFIQDEEYTLDKVFDLYDELSKPLIINNHLDKKNFMRAKKLLEAAILRLEKYPAAKANSWALHIFFKDTLRDYTPRGDLEELNKITMDDLYQYYLECMKDEEVTFMIGDYDGISLREYKDTITPKEDHNFLKRASLDKDIYFYPYPSNQMNLRIIFDISIFTGDMKLYPIILLNYYLGVSSYSYFFQIVREKYGLCYSISTDLYGASGIIMLSAEIKKKDLNIVLEKIDEALNTCLLHMDLERMKRMINLTYLAGYDAQGAYFSDLITKRAFPIAYDKDTYTKCIDAVTIKDMEEALDTIKKCRRVVFGYGGDIHE